MCASKEDRLPSRNDCLSMAGSSRSTNCPSKSSPRVPELREPGDHRLLRPAASVESQRDDNHQDPHRHWPHQTHRVWSQDPCQSSPCLTQGADRITYPLNFEVTDASKTAIDYIAKQGGNVKLIYRSPLKLKEHVFPEKYPLPLMDPITPNWRVNKLIRKEEARGITIAFPKPKWLLADMKKEL